jgi:predicted nucleic acid-binding protein
VSEPPRAAGLLDTSVFIAEESGRPVRPLPAYAAVSVVTVAELRLGVLMADDPDTRARRMRTLTTLLERFTPLPIDVRVADHFAEIVASARRSGRRPKIMDAWIAATAVAHDLPVFTQDDGFASIPHVHSIKV